MEVYNTWVIESFGQDKTHNRYDTVENLVTMLREYLPPNITVGIHCSLEDLYPIQVSLKDLETMEW